jgi:HlyD family secretion protein
MVMPTPPGGGNRAEEGGSSGNSVFVLRENTPVRVSVQVGESNDSFTEIVSGDLAEGDMVITDAINAD